MKREPFTVNTAPHSDPPASVMDDLWLDEGERSPPLDTFGGSTRDQRSTRPDPFGVGVDDPFGNFGGEDPFASPSSQRGSPPKSSLREKRQEELRRRAEAEAEIKRQSEARRRAQVEREKQLRAQAEQEEREKQLRAQAEQEARRRAQAEQEAQRRAQAEQEAQRRAQAEQEARRRAQAEQEAQRRAQAEQEARRRAQAEQEAQRRAQAEQEAQRRAQAEQEAQRRAQAEQEARRRAQAEQEARRRAQAEQEARRRAQAEQKAQRRAQAEQEARRRAQAEQEAQRRAQAAQEAQRRAQAEQEARRRAQAEQEAQRRAHQAEQEAQRRAQAEQDARRRAHHEQVGPSREPVYSQSPRALPISQPPAQRSAYTAPPSVAPPPQSSPRGVTPDQLQRILMPMHQLMRKQADELKQLRGALDHQKHQPTTTSASESAEVEEMRRELNTLREELNAQHHALQETRAQALQAQALVQLSSVQPTRSVSSKPSWGRGLFSSISGALSALKPKRAKSFEELRSMTSSGETPTSPSVPVYDPFEESTDIELLLNGQQELKGLKHEEDSLLHRPVVTNAPQGFEPEDDLNNELEGDQGRAESQYALDDSLEISFEDDSEIELSQAERQDETDETPKVSPEPNAPTAQPVIGMTPPEFSVGGLTMSRFAPAGPDPQLMSIVMQHTQLLKRQEHGAQQLAAQIKGQEEVAQAQSEVLEQLIKRSQRENDKLGKRVQKLERARDLSQQNTSALKSHHKRLSQLEMLIEGFEAKLAAFDEKLSSKDPTKQATDIRVSLDPDEGDYQSIQEAINAAPVGAYIGVMPGIYEDPIELIKPVKIIGLGRPQDILIQIKEESALVLKRMGGLYEESISAEDEKEVRKKLQQYTSAQPTTVGSQVMNWFKRQIGQPVADEGVFESKTGTDEVSLVSVTISSITTEVGGPPSERPAIVVTSGHLRLEKCEVRCENGHGIRIEGEDARLTMRASRITQVRGSGIVLRTRAQATLSGTSVIKSKESGIDGQGYTSVRLMDCEISNNYRIGVQLGFKSQLIAYNSTISGNHFEGVWMNNKSTGTVKGCDMRGNARGPYDISSDCNVEMVGNKP